MTSFYTVLLFQTEKDSVDGLKTPENQIKCNLSRYSDVKYI